MDVNALSCRDREAEEVLVLVTEWPEGSGRADVLRVLGADVEVEWASEAQSGEFRASGEEALLFRGPNAAAIQEIASLDLASGSVRSIVRVPEGTWHAAMSPDGSHVAGLLLADSAEPSDVFAQDLSTGETTTVSLPTGTATLPLVKWIDQASFALFPLWEESDVRVYDSGLRLLSTFRGWSGRPVLAAGMAHGTSGSSLLEASLPDGPVHTVRDLERLGRGSSVAVIREDLDGSSPDGRPAGRPEAISGPTRSSPPAIWPWVLLSVLGGTGALVGWSTRRSRGS